MALSHLLIFGAVLAAAAATDVVFTQCSGVSQEHCSVSGVRVTPCKKPGQCILSLGSNTSLSFDFTPNFSTSNLVTMVYYQNQEFKGLGDSNACLYTTCPTAAGVSQTFDYNLHIGKKLPPGKYPISWKVWNADNTEQVCCFLITIKLKK